MKRRLHLAISHMSLETDTIDVIMAHVSPWKIAAIGCLGGLALLIVFTIGFVWFLPIISGTRRVPNEIPLGALIQEQESVLNPGWMVIQPWGAIISDSDFTHGLWVYDVHFDPLTTGFSVHTFNSPSLAERWFPPTSWVFDYKADGNPPSGWTYIPPHADRFTIDCQPKETPEQCNALVVYQEYSLVFRVRLIGEMSLDDLQPMLEVTDQFMADSLSNTRLEPGERSIPTLSEPGLQSDPG